MTTPSPMTVMLDLTPANLLKSTSLPFIDAKGCKNWLANLAVTDVPKAHHTLMEIIDRLNLTELNGFERLKIMELLRDKVAFLQDAIAEVYTGRTLPLPNTRSDIWESSLNLWHGMEKGYRYCLRKAANNDDETAKYVALIVERCMRYLGLQMRHHLYIHRPVPGRVLSHLHALFHFAEKRGVAHMPVKDSLDGHRGVATAAQIYIRALLVEAANPFELLSIELNAIDALLKKWSSKVVISRITPEHLTHTLRCTDLAGEKGLWAVSETLKEKDRIIYLDLKEILESLKRRIRKMHSGTPWNELGLPPEFSQVSTLTLLHHLENCWCGPVPVPIPELEYPEKFEIAGGFSAIYHCLTGKAFEAPRQLDELDSKEATQVAMFGKIIHRLASDTTGSQTPAEIWKLEKSDNSHLILRRPLTGHVTAGLQLLICLKKDSSKEYQIGVIHSILDNGPSGIEVRVTVLPGRPEPVVMRCKDTPFNPAIRMHLISDTGKSLQFLIPPGSYQHGKIIEVRTDIVRLYKMTALKQKAVGFDYISCESV